MTATIEYGGINYTVDGEWIEAERASRDYPGMDAGFGEYRITLENDDRDLSDHLSTHAVEEILALAADQVEFTMAMKEEA